jgi:hypothetical protein
MLASVSRFSKTVARAAAGVLACSLGLPSPPALADEAAVAAEVEAVVSPPVPQRAFLQYGVAFTVEGVASSGPICDNPGNPCILGSGGGVAVRVGWRPSERLYLGGAYELTKQESDKLYQLGILQQARGELREYIPTGHRTTPFALLGVGLAGYGNEWSIATWGPTATVGAGLEVEVSGGLLLDVSLAYRPLYLQRFVDSSTLSHDAGIAQFVGFELAVEAQEAL